MKKDRKSIGEILKLIFSPKSIGSKISFIMILNGIIIIVALIIIFSNTIYEQEISLTDSRLNSDINFLHLILEKKGNEKWSLENGAIYYDDVKIGDGTTAGENSADFEEFEKLSGTFGYCLMLDKDFKEGTDEGKGYICGHYIRVAGSTKDENGNSIVGTHLDKKICDVIDSGNKNSGIANVNGRKIYTIYQPIFDSENNVIGAIAVGRAINEINKDTQRAVSKIAIFIAVIVIAGTVTIIIISIKWLENVETIDKYLHKIINGDIPKERLKLKTKDSIADVAEVINQLIDSLREKERMGTELGLAKAIQANMLPCVFPAYPMHDEFDLYASMNPAKEVGGDFYDFFMPDDSTIVLVIADVSGKGVPASLVMAISKILIKNYFKDGMSPAQVLTAVNKTLCDGNEQGMFVTAWVAKIDLETGEMTIANAGHNLPMIKRKDGKFEKVRIASGFVLGGLEDFEYKEKIIPLCDGDRLFLYTDGVTEAVDVNNELYGTDRLLDYLNSHISDSVKDVIDGMNEELDKYSGEAEQFDDITMLMFELKNKMIKTDVHELEFPASDEALGKASEFIEERLSDAGFPNKQIMQILVAIEEIFVNIAHYAYPNDTVGTVNIGVCERDGGIRITFIDSGKQFNPLETEDPDIHTSAEEREIGGLGIFIVKKTMDELNYIYRDGKNILTMFKKKG